MHILQRIKNKKKKKTGKELCQQHLQNYVIYMGKHTKKKIDENRSPHISSFCYSGSWQDLRSG